MPQGRCADIVMKLRPEAADPGEIFDLDGNIIKTHDGFVNFTVGQRKDLGIGGRQDADGEDSEPLYVIRIEPEARRVFAGPKSAPAKTVLKIREFSWLGGEGDGAGDIPVMARLHSSQTPFAATLTRGEGGVAELTPDEPQFGVSAGQAAVLYDAETCSRVLGGGWIVSV